MEILYICSLCGNFVHLLWLLETGLYSRQACTRSLLWTAEFLTLIGDLACARVCSVRRSGVYSTVRRSGLQCSTPGSAVCDARVYSVRRLGLQCATPGSAVCDAWVCSVDAWVCSVRRLGLQCATSGYAVCDAWVCSVRRLGMQCATPGSAVCDAWVCSVRRLGMQCATPGSELCDARVCSVQCISCTRQDIDNPRVSDHNVEMTSGSILAPLCSSQAITSSMANQIRRHCIMLHTAVYQHGWPLVLCFL